MKGTEEPLLLTGSMRGLDPRLHAPSRWVLGLAVLVGVVSLVCVRVGGKVVCGEGRKNVKHHAGKGGAPCAGTV